MKVWIAQCLCPQRHAILAAAEACEAAVEAVALEASLRKAIAGLLNATTLNPWCGICHAPESSWTYETKPTEFPTMEEANKAIRVAQAANIAAGITHGELLGPKK